MFFTGQNYVSTEASIKFSRLDEILLVKISDFSFTRQVTENGYYVASDDRRALPLRWMSIESIENKLYSSQSDVVCIVSS